MKVNVILAVRHLDKTSDFFLILKDFSSLNKAFIIIIIIIIIIINPRGFSGSFQPLTRLITQLRGSH